MGRSRWESGLQLATGRRQDETSQIGGPASTVLLVTHGEPAAAGVVALLVP